MTRPRRDILAAVTSVLADAADPARAPGMQAYMKAAMPCYGVGVPEVRRLTRAVFTEHRIADRAVWEATVRAMYDEATHREERYAALGLVAHRAYKSFATPESLTLYEHLIRSGGWWDLVDETSHRVGDVLLAHRQQVEPVIRHWSRSDNLWVRRSAIICQLGHRAETDPALLADTIKPNMGDRDFFIRKAIGWAMREYAYTDPLWVRAFVSRHHEELAPLSIREALRRIGPG